MKYFTFLLFFLPNLLFGQFIQNPSFSHYEVRVIRNGKLVHKHIMKPFDLFKINSDPTDRVELYFKVCEQHCDQTNKRGQAIINSSNGNFYTNILKGGWELAILKPCRFIKWKKELNIEDGWYFYTYILPLTICKQT